MKKRLKIRMCMTERERENGWKSPYLLAPSVLPGEPVFSIAGVLQPVAAGKLPPMAIGMATLGADQGQEVQSSQVNLEILRAAREDRPHWTPRPIPFTCAQPAGETERERKRED